MLTTVSFGDWVRRQRKALDLTQHALAHRVGCAPVTIRKIESDTRKPSCQMAERLAEHLAISSSERLLFVQCALGERSPLRLALPQQARATDPAALPVRTNLPVPLTALVGRKQEIAAVCALLRTTDVRLTTLTGPGGVGKTRLALQVAENLRQDFADGVYFVPLASIGEAKLIVSAIAQVLSIRETGDQPLLDSLKLALKAKASLLVLDNFEHLLAAAPIINELLTACPHLKILVTSRALLHLYGEHEFSVPVLTLPTCWQNSLLATLVAYEAIELFRQRARAVKPDFVFDNRNVPAVAEICARLDGLPLAIELAAARSKFFSPQALLRQFNGSTLQALQNGAHDMPARHKTLRHAIAWSYDLLTPNEQTLLRRLSIFVGGFTLAAAQAICAADHVLTSLVLDDLASLVNKSLLGQIEQDDGELRFALLETIREFGLELLQARDELAAVQRAHAQYYTAFALELLVDTNGPHRRAIFAGLAVEQDNIRATLQWATTHRSLALAVRLAAPLLQFWGFRGHYAEGREQVENILAFTGGMEPSAELASVIYCAGFLAHVQSDFRTARLRYEQSLQMSRQGSYLWSLSHSAALLANVAFEQGHYSEAKRLLDEGLGAGEQMGTLAWHCAVMLANKANHALLSGHFAEAQMLCEQALQRHQPIGDPWAIAQMYEFRSHLAYLQGDYAAARTLVDQSDLYNQAVKDPRQAANGIDLRGLMAIEVGELTTAQRLLAEAFKLRYKLGSQHDLALSLQNIAQLAVAQMQPARALCLMGAATALQSNMGMVLPPMLRKRFDQIMHTAQQLLNREAATAAWHAGGKMKLDEIVAYALAEE